MTQDAPYMTAEKEHKQTKGKRLLHQWKNDDQQWEFFLLSPKKNIGSNYDGYAEYCLGC